MRVDVFFTRFGATIELTVGAMIFGLAFGIPLGYMAAKRRGGVAGQQLHRRSR